MIYAFVIGCYIGLVLYNFFHKKFRIAEYEDGLYWIESNMILIPFAWSNRISLYKDGDLERGHLGDKVLIGVDDVRLLEKRLKIYYDFLKKKKVSKRRKRVLRKPSKPFNHKRAREINEELETATGKKFDRLIKELNELTR